MNGTHARVYHEPRLGFLCSVWLPCQVPDVLDFALTFVWGRDLRHEPVARQLRGLRYLEGTEHDKDEAPALYSANAARSVCPSVAQSVDIVEQWHGDGRAK